MHRQLTATLLALVLLAGAASPAAAQPAAIGGTVTDGSGSPLAGIAVTLVAAENPSDPVVTSSTAGDGTWSADLPDGDYHLLVSDPDGAHAYAWWPDDAAPQQPVRVRGGGTTQDLDLALNPGARVSGRVLGPSGPVAGARVRLAGTPLSPARAETAADGRFELAGLREGASTLVATTSAAELSDASATVDVERGGTATVELLVHRVPVGVERVSGSERVATAVEASRRGFPRADTVVIAAAGAFPDALAASPLAATVGGPLLLVGPRLTPPVLEEVRRLGASAAVIVGAVAAVPLVVQEELARAGLRVRRIAGDSRFDTAALIAREVGGGSGRAILASGLEFADALSVAPLAAAERIPILLTAPDHLVGDTARALDDLGVTETLVVGGSAAVSDAALRGVPSPTRVYGRTRYETSLAIARHWAERGMSMQTVSVATGRNFPDALAAGPIAGLADGPLLLVDGQDPRTPGDTYAWITQQRGDIAGIQIFGGTAAVTSAVAARLEQALGVGR